MSVLGQGSYLANRLVKALILWQASEWVRCPWFRGAF